jgi:hypothetical protein
VVEPLGQRKEAGKQRFGTCHRCGWKRPVSAVDRNERKQLEIGRTYGRLCNECRADLLASQTRPVPQPLAQPIRSKGKSVGGGRVA